MSAQAVSYGVATQTSRTPAASPFRRALARGLQATSRWLDQRAYALEFPEERVSVQLSDAGPSQVEVVRDPHTGFAVVYVNGERQFTFVRGLERL
jgi:hypothetical protein